MQSKVFFVYILANASGMLYVGFTNNLQRRIFEHKQKLVEGYTKKYNLTILVYYEEFPTAIAGIEREKQIKRWRREKKFNLIKTVNSSMSDLAADWFPGGKWE
jgi:putative endonuclease